MSEPGPVRDSPWSVIGRIGVDWWAVIVAGVLVVLAVADVLPKVPW